MKPTKNFPFATLITALLALLGAMAIIASCLGAFEVSPQDTYAILSHHLFGAPLPESIDVASDNVIWQLRFPRIILGIAAGAGLALSGVVMQAAVQNTLAEPYILGVSSGATLGATFSLMLGIPGTPLFSFAGSLLASVAVLMLASLGSRMSAAKLVLSGMVLNALFSALSNAIVTVFSSAEGMLDLKFWTMGSLTRASWSNIGLASGVIAGASLFFLTQFRPLNALLMGDDVATSLGLSPARLRWVYLGVSALMIGTLVAAVGTIGFVGLMVPHIARALCGSDHRRLIPLAILIGAIGMLACDAAARVLLENVEIPIGIITAAIGAPFFAYVMVTRNYSYQRSSE